LGIEELNLDNVQRFQGADFLRGILLPKTDSVYKDTEDIDGAIIREHEGFGGIFGSNIKHDKVADIFDGDTVVDDVARVFSFEANGRNIEAVMLIKMGRKCSSSMVRISFFDDVGVVYKIDTSDSFYHIHPFLWFKVLLGIFYITDCK